MTAVVLAPAPAVALATIGPARLTLDGVEAPLSSRKALAILVYLALQPARTESRERIATMLWSDSAADHARAALRQTLRRLKADLGPAEDLLDADRSVLRLTRPVKVDVVEAAEAAARGEPPALLAQDDADLSRLFADLEDLDSDFDLWVAVQRERLTAQLVSRLEAAMAAAEDDGRRLALAEALTRAEPTHEGACRAAMQAHLARGDTIHAMRIYERLWKTLDEELDVEPSEKTQALYVAIKQGQIQPPAPEPETGELLAPIAIVVEPAPHGDLPESYRYIAQTFRHEMIGALSRFRDWMVIDGPRNASSPPTYRSYDLRITMLDQHGAVAVAMSLTDRASGRCIWAERQAAALDELARLQQTALRNLAVALNVHLSAPRLQTAREITSPMGRKYELWLQAQALTDEWRVEARVRAEEILRDLIATTPGFAQAMVALAKNINVRPIIYPGTQRDPAAFEESLALSARAVAIDPLDSRAHLCRYWSYAMSDQHGAALAHLALALDLNENDPWTIISAAVGFAFAGEIERARELVDQARAFGMRHSRAALGYIATTLYLCGDYEGSLAAAEVAGDSMTDLAAWAAASHMQLGDPERAARAMETFLRYTTAAWVGRERPTEAQAVEWFLTCFPIRNPAVRDELRARLMGAVAEAKKRRP
jgi:DNA-binding SARP family transcriptional activator/TolB-like protein